MAYQDLHPGGGARRKVAGVVQMSESTDYKGGNLLIHHAGRARAPSATLVVVPAGLCTKSNPCPPGSGGPRVNGRAPLLQ